MSTTTAVVFLIHIVCYRCGTVFGIERFYHTKLLEHKSGSDGHGEFYCPNGHSQVYRDTEIDRLRADVLRLESSLEFTRKSRDKALKAESVQRGLAARYKRRAIAGVCPVCKRSFKQVRDHIHTKHPKQEQELLGKIK